MRKPLTALVLTLLAAAQLIAQAPMPLPVPLPSPLPATGVSGTVFSVDGSRITIFEGRITIDASRAQFRSQYGAAQLVDVRPGTRISAYVTPRTGGALEAQTIILIPDPDALITGPIESVDAAAGTLTVAGQTIRIVQQTRLQGRGGAAMFNIRDLLPGQVVQVELDRTQAGLTARSLGLIAPMPLPQVSVTGSVVSIESGVWTIRTGDRTVTFRTNNDTKIVGSPRAGDQVVVFYRIDSASEFIALNIAPAPSTLRPTIRPAPNAVTGTIQQLSSTSIVVETRDRSVVTVAIDADTRFYGGKAVAGDLVVVNTVTKTDGTRSASTVVKLLPDTPQVTFHGVISAINGNVWRIDGQSVIVDANTRFISSSAPGITSLPTVGERVHVIARRTADALVALFIERS